MDCVHIIKNQITDDRDNNIAFILSYEFQKKIIKFDFSEFNDIIVIRKIGFCS